MASDTKGKSRKQLEKMKSEIEKAIAKLDQKDRKAAKAAAEKAAKQHGFTLAELSGGSAAPKRKAKAAGPKGKPMYRNPENSSQTWTGKGRKPNWYLTATAAGKTEKDLKI